MPADTYKEMVTMEKYRAVAHRPIFTSFDDYAKAHPEGECFRTWLTRHYHQELTILPYMPNWCGLPGDYCWAYIAPFYEWVPGAQKMQLTKYYQVHVHDSDDSGASKFNLTLEEAKQEIENLKLLAPFKILELRDFGYRL